MSTIGSCLAFSSLEVRSVSVCRRPTTSLRITRMPSMISITGLICSGSAPLPLAVSHQAYGTRFPTSRGTRRYIGLAFVKHHGRPSDSREVLSLWQLSSFSSFDASVNRNGVLFAAFSSHSWLLLRYIQLSTPAFFRSTVKSIPRLELHSTYLCTLLRLLSIV